MASRIKGRGASREDGPYSKDLLKLSKKELTKELTVLIDELRNFEQVRAREEKEVPGRRPQLSRGHYSKRTQWRCAAVESARAAGAAGGGGGEAFCEAQLRRRRCTLCPPAPVSSTHSVALSLGQLSFLSLPHYVAPNPSCHLPRPIITHVSASLCHWTDPPCSRERKARKGWSRSQTSWQRRHSRNTQTK